MSERKLEDWLAGYLDYTKNTEPPLAFHIWVAISTISAALERRCYMRWGHSQIFPNQYIVLIGPSGQSRKGEAINLARPFIDHIGIVTGSQSIIREALIKKLKESTAPFQSASGDTKFQSALTIISEELTVFLGQKDTRLLGDMTDWYDSRDEWTYETKHQGVDRVTGVCVNLLGATAPDWLPSILPNEAVGGGWTSRVIFVVESYKGKVVSNPNLFSIDTELKKDLEHDLEQIHLLRGRFEFSDEALAAYVSWYEAQERGIKKGIYPVPDPKFSGYVSRRATHIKKVAMALSASRGDDLIITLEDFRRAQMVLETAEKKMTRAFTGLGRAKFSDLTDAVLQYIRRRRKVRRSTLLQETYRDIDMWTLEQIERVLEQMKMIKLIVLNDDRDVEYVYVGPTTEEAEPPDPDMPAEEQTNTQG